MRGSVSLLDLPVLRLRQVIYFVVRAQNLFTPVSLARYRSIRHTVSEGTESSFEVGLRILRRDETDLLMYSHRIVVDRAHSDDVAYCIGVKNTGLLCKN